MLRTLVAGKSNKEIAGPLDVGVRTVKAHVSHLMRKVDVNSRMAVSVYARWQGNHFPNRNENGLAQEKLMESTPRSNVYMDALGHLYTGLPDLPAWFRRLTRGQREDIARLMADWATPSRRVGPADQRGHSYIPKIKDVERDLIHQAIQTCHGDISQASKALGVGKTTIYRKLSQWGEEPKLLSQASALAESSGDSQDRAVHQ